MLTNEMTKGLNQDANPYNFLSDELEELSGWQDVCEECGGQGKIKKEGRKHARKCKACHGVGFILNEDGVMIMDAMHALMKLSELHYYVHFHEKYKAEMKEAAKEAREDAKQMQKRGTKPKKKAKKPKKADKS